MLHVLLKESYSQLNHNSKRKMLSSLGRINSFAKFPIIINSSARAFASLIKDMEKQFIVQQVVPDVIPQAPTELAKVFVGILFEIPLIIINDLIES